MAVDGSWIVLAGGFVALLTAGGAQAAGYALKEQSAAGQGEAFAGAAAKAEDATTLFANPAGMARLSGSQAVVSGAFIAPTAKFKNGSASRAAAYGGSAISGPSSTGDVVLDAFVPALYGVYDVDPRWKVGLAITAPWGLATKYDADWIGRYHAIKSEMQTLNIAPSVSYRINRQWSVGGGLQFQRIKAELTNAVDFGSLIRLPGRADGFAKVKGDDWGWGYTFGVLWEPATTTRLGLSYRSAIHHKLDGNAQFSGVPAVPALRASFANTGASAKVTTPEMVMFGAYHELSPQWAVLFETSWTNWSRFRQLVVSFDNPLRGPSVTEERWEDGWFFSLGANYRPTDRWTLRAGVAYDLAPTPDEHRTPRIPDTDRVWLAAGATYKLTEAVSISAAYTHIFGLDADVNLRDGGPGTTDNLRGNLTGSYDSHVDILTVQAKVSF